MKARLCTRLGSVSCTNLTARIKQFPGIDSTGIYVLVMTLSVCLPSPYIRDNSENEDFIGCMMVIMERYFLTRHAIAFGCENYCMSCWNEFLKERASAGIAKKAKKEATDMETEPEHGSAA